MAQGRKSGWSERGEEGGRPKTGRITQFKSFSVSCYPQEYEKLKEIAANEGVSMSRLLIDTVLDKYR